jgi:hypothetical protein
MEWKRNTQTDKEARRATEAKSYKDREITDWLIS